MAVFCKIISIPVNIRMIVNTCTIQTGSPIVYTRYHYQSLENLSLNTVSYLLAVYIDSVLFSLVGWVAFFMWISLFILETI